MAIRKDAMKGGTKKVAKKKVDAEETETKKAPVKKPAAKKSTAKTTKNAGPGQEKEPVNTAKGVGKPDGNKIAEKAAEASGGKTTGTAAKKGGDIYEAIGEGVMKNGVPMVKISMSAKELIPTGKYANVDVGPVTITRFVEDGDEDHLAAECHRLAEVVEFKVMGELREQVLSSLKADAAD